MPAKRPRTPSGSSVEPRAAAAGQGSRLAGGAGPGRSPRGAAAGRTPDRPPAPSRLPRTPGLAPGARLDAHTYFLVLDNVARLFGRDRASHPPDIDAVIDIALRRAEAGRHSVSSPDRYDAWVSVVCRNAYLNFIRSRRDCRSVSEFDAVHDPRQSFDTVHDAAIVRDAVVTAIARLPPFLRDVARMRFIEHRSHRTISLRTGHPLPVTRAYANKAATRLRKDATLRDLANDWRG